MTLPTDAILPYAQSGRSPSVLKHHLLKLKNTQARLRGKIALVPDVDLDKYRFRAVVDWVEFRVQFARGVQVQHLQPILNTIFGRNCHINAEDKGPGDVFTRCTIRVQAPRRLALVKKAHHALVSAFGEIGTSQITGIEISVDAYPDEPSEQARGFLLGAMQRTIWTDRDIWKNRDSRPRMIFTDPSKTAWEKNVTKLSPPTRKEPLWEDGIDPNMHKSPYLDATLYLGAKYDEIMIRLMDKIIDDQHPSGTSTILTEDEKRVRVEVTLQGSVLEDIGLTDVGSLKEIVFTKMQKRYFQIKLPTLADKHPTVRLVVQPITPRRVGRLHMRDAERQLCHRFMLSHSLSKRR